MVIANKSRESVVVGDKQQDREKMSRLFKDRNKRFSSLLKNNLYGRRKNGGRRREMAWFNGNHDRLSRWRQKTDPGDHD